MITIGKATLQSDENGLVTLQCDRCKSRFKVECGYPKFQKYGIAFPKICIRNMVSRWGSCQA